MTSAETILVANRISDDDDDDWHSLVKGYGHTLGGSVTAKWIINPDLIQTYCSEKPPKKLPV